MKHNWEYKRLTQLSDILYGFPFDSALFNSESKGIPLIRIRDVKPGFTSTFYNGSYSDIYLVKKGEYLIGMDGEFNIAPWQSERALLNQRVCRIKSLNEKVILSDFIYYFLRKELKIIESKTSYVTVKHLSAKALNAIIVPVPPMEVQEQIVAELDKINEVITDCRELLSNLSALEKSIFYDMFGDPISNPKGWEVKKLGDIAQIASGGTPSRKKIDYFTGNINWYSAGELNSMFLSDSIEKITQNALDETSAKLFPKGSLLVGMYDTAAFKLGILKTDGSSNQACANVALFEDNVIWLYYVLMLMKDEALKHRHGARQKNLNLGFIKDFTIPIAPLCFQQEFAEKIEAIEAQKKTIMKTIATLKALLNSRMDYYFG